MDPHFRAFSFVDRITSLQANRRVSGQYTIPADLPGFSNSLVAEATGQLAAWAAMAALDFSHRPVAGLAGRVELLSQAHPGDLLELAADLQSVDVEAVAYNGTATVRGQTVVRLQDCVGPMMSLSEFDDPEAVRRRFDLLQRGGVIPCGFGGVPDFPLAAKTLHPDQSLHAQLHVPGAAEFFADHFPRRPLFPGTFLTHACLKLAADLMDRTAPTPPGRGWNPRVILDVKLRSFIPPGEVLDLSACIKEARPDHATVSLQIHHAGQRRGTLRVELAREGIR